jgi:phenylacetate-CoA ligase
MKKRKDASKTPTFFTASWDAWRTAREGKLRIAQRQQERLQELVAYARTQSRYFAQVYRDVPEQVTSVQTQS